MTWRRARHYSGPFLVSASAALQLQDADNRTDSRFSCRPQTSVSRGGQRRLGEARWVMQRVQTGVRSEAVEGAHWFKSRRSGGNGNCVEVARLADGCVAMRNSRYPEGPVLVYTPEEIMAFLGGVKDGEFDFTLSRD
ncbi:DUF397 domain-containing protein [Streptomyces longwoodensis]|uniref:DUF397 domain-containing protein n=2 Tax=Streptomyces longwoodensis TaxID=68231 RepID=UPI0036869C9E